MTKFLLVLCFFFTHFILEKNFTMEQSFTMEKKNENSHGLNKSLKVKSLLFNPKAKNNHSKSFTYTGKNKNLKEEMPSSSSHNKTIYNNEEFYETISHLTPSSKSSHQNSQKSYQKNPSSQKLSIEIAQPHPKQSIHSYSSRKSKKSFNNPNLSHEIMITDSSNQNNFIPYCREETQLLEDNLTLDEYIQAAQKMVKSLDYLIHEIENTKEFHKSHNYISVQDQQLNKDIYCLNNSINPSPSQNLITNNLVNIIHQNHNGINRPEVPVTHSIYIIDEEDESDIDESLGISDVQPIQNKDAVASTLNQLINGSVLSKNPSVNNFHKYLIPSSNSLSRHQKPKHFPASPSFKAKSTAFIFPLKSHHNTIIYEGTENSLEIQKNNKPLMKKFSTKPAIYTKVHNYTPAFPLKKSQTPSHQRHKSDSIIWESFMDRSSTKSSVLSSSQSNNPLLINKIINVNKKIKELKIFSQEFNSSPIIQGNCLFFMELMMKKINNNVKSMDNYPDLVQKTIEILDGLTDLITSCFDENYKDMLAMTVFYLNDSNWEILSHHLKKNKVLNKITVQSIDNNLLESMMLFLYKSLENNNFVLSKWDKTNKMIHYSWRKSIQTPWILDSWDSINMVEINYPTSNIEKNLIINQEKLNQNRKEYNLLSNFWVENIETYEANYKKLWDNLFHSAQIIFQIAYDEMILKVLEVKNNHCWCLTSDHIFILERGYHKNPIKKIFITAIDREHLLNIKYKTIEHFIQHYIKPLIDKDNNMANLEKEPLLEKFMVLIEDILFDIFFYHNNYSLGFLIVDIE